MYNHYVLWHSLHSTSLAVFNSGQLTVGEEDNLCIIKWIQSQVNAILPFVSIRIVVYIFGQRTKLKEVPGRLRLVAITML